jgi:hypothetical protein
MIGHRAFRTGLKRICGAEPRVCSLSLDCAFDDFASFAFSAAGRLFSRRRKQGVHLAQLGLRAHAGAGPRGRYAAGFGDFRSAGGSRDESIEILENAYAFSRPPRPAASDRAPSRSVWTGSDRREDRHAASAASLREMCSELGADGQQGICANLDLTIC